MTMVSFIAIIGIGFLVITALILMAILRLLSGRRSGSGGLDADEARMMQEIHQGLEKMEKRVDSLETLLLERERKDKL